MTRLLRSPFPVAPTAPAILRAIERSAHRWQDVIKPPHKPSRLSCESMRCPVESEGVLQLHAKRYASLASTTLVAFIVNGALLQPAYC